MGVKECRKIQIDASGKTEATARASVEARVHVCWAVAQTPIPILALDENPSKDRQKSYTPRL